MFTYSYYLMFPHNNEGRNQLLKDYDQEQMQEIADHGCKSGVCSEHIYYADTIAFFDKYEGEILDLIHERYGVDELVSIFKRSEACYDMYRNECTWLFIENVATDVVIDNEESELAEERLIEEYMQPVDNYMESIPAMLQQSAEELRNLTVYNPPGSMNLNRYSHS